jgi:hypothetical protein
MAEARQSTQPIEVALPSGVFARIRPARFIDKLLASVDQEKLLAEIEREGTGDERDLGKGNAWVVCIIARMVIFDDKRLTPREVLLLDSRDSDALLNYMLPYLNGPVR